ncbi:hypothetical protein BKA65DRAFT_532133 [Rhexocercosporidium sp. MPI-PUGE-AT-0058]|nr:hypothetical protein BKA65DRAFT_532133 [Rhexocercosporidium sp. MPI-PUGE-AT-0058]
MPSIAEANVSRSSKKRRRDDVSSAVDLQIKMSSSHHPRRPYESIPPQHDAQNRDDLYARHIITPKRRSHDSKRQRIGHLDLDRRDAYFAFGPRADTSIEQHGDAIAPRQASKSSGKIDLSPCHICRRKPTVRSELDAFGDCKCCGERTCYICTRKCEGPGVMWRASIHAKQTLDGECMVLEDACYGGSLGIGMGHRLDDDSGQDKHFEDGGRSEHRDQICSACCLERGPEGDIWCLGCLRAEEAG